MSATNTQASNATQNAGSSTPHPGATHQEAAGEKPVREVSLNGSRIRMVWMGQGWTNYVVGAAR